MQLELFVDSLDTVVRRLRLAGALHGQAREEPATLDRGLEPASFLASLVDFRGGIALDAALRAEPASLAVEGEAVAEGAPEAWPRSPRALEARARAALADVDRLLQQQLHGAGLEGLLSPLRMHRVLQVRGALDPAQVDRLAAPFDLRLRQALALVPREMAAVRRSLGQALRQLGPAVARLERLDAALQTTTHGELERLQERLLLAYHAGFARALQLARGAGPSTVELQAQAFEPGGWVRAHFDLGSQVAHAVLALARARVQSLLRAALELAGPETELTAVDRPLAVDG